MLDKINCVTRLDERIFELDEKKIMNLHENQKFQEEICRLNDKRIMNIKIIRETIEESSQPLKRKLNETEKPTTSLSKKTAN